jgi:cobalt-zinc-cadmium efflux system membrane fusion protein
LRARAAWIAAATGIAAAIAVALGARPASTAAAEPGAIEARVLARGVVEPAGGVARIRAPRPGVIGEVRGRAGDAAREGDLLAELRPRDPEPAARITATIAGVVIARHVQPGDEVQAGEALFELCDPASLEVRLEIEELDALRVALNQEVALRAPNQGSGSGAPLATGAIQRLGAALERRSAGAADARLRADGRIRPAWVPLSPAPAGLLIGQEIEAEIALPSAAVPVRVPRGAVRIRDGLAVVRAWRGWRWREIPVALGPSDARWVAVEGIAPGTEVAIDE